MPEPVALPPPLPLLDVAPELPVAPELAVPLFLLLPPADGAAVARMRSKTGRSETLWGMFTASHVSRMFVLDARENERAISGSSS